MRAFEFSRCALSISVAAALLGACGGRLSEVQGDLPPIGATTGAAPLAHNKSFGFTGAEQTFVVPGGVTQLTVSAHGGAGTGFNIRNYDVPGFPGRIYAVIKVHPATSLTFLSAGQAQMAGSTAAVSVVPTHMGVAATEAVHRTFARAAISSRIASSLPRAAAARARQIFTVTPTEAMAAV